MSAYSGLLESFMQTLSIIYAKSQGKTNDGFDPTDCCTVTLKDVNCKHRNSLMSNILGSASIIFHTLHGEREREIAQKSVYVCILDFFFLNM